MSVSKKRIPLLLAIPFVGLATIGGCQIRIGGGGNYGDLNLAVPYYSQPDFLLCSPTSVLMWRRFDGLSYVTPESLGNQMGCHWRTTGCSTDQLVWGARNFTSSGVDSYLDDYSGEGDPDDLRAWYFSRQITSLKNGVPVIGLINGALHAVVVKGGRYTTATNGLKQWDFVTIHDPQEGQGGIRRSAGRWMLDNVQTVVAAHAIVGWEGGFSTYGHATRARGWRRWPI